jgi:flagellar protein FlaH|tara:strand:+ start:477 stop:1184 length:708 start_codon:yes stop_codon:yes gene_type:complete
MEAKPIEDGFPFGVDQDSLADTLGAKIPNRSIGILSGAVGAGKSLISQRLILGLLENGAKVVVVTTELTTRGWIEQMDSIGYHIIDYIRNGKLLVISRYGTMAEPVLDVSIADVLKSEAMSEADIVFIDSASSIMPDIMDSAERFEMLDMLRRFTAENRSVILGIDEDEIDQKTARAFKSSSEILIDLSAQIVGGALKRQIKVTRFLRAAGPLQTTIGWRVEPSMGFIVDITAVS